MGTPRQRGAMFPASGAARAGQSARPRRRTPHPALAAAALLLLLLVPGAAALYHTAAETLHWYSHKSTVVPDRMSYTTLTDAQSGVSMPLATLGRRPAGGGAPRVLFIFGEHCREVITTEVGLWLARLLVDDHGGVRGWPELHAALERAGERPGAGGWAETVKQWADDILKSMTIQIIPIESVEGRRLVEGGEMCLRKTAVTHVDLNRNWPFAWVSSNPATEQYGGPSPLSEPQSRLLKGLVDGGPLTAYINVHSGEWAVYTPWDSKPGYGPGLPGDLPKIVDRIGSMCNCVAGPAGAVSGYLAFGSSMDYAYVHAKVPYPLTIEVYGGDNQGILPDGANNKPLAEFPLIPLDKSEISTASARQASGKGGSGGGQKAAAGRGRSRARRLKRRQPEDGSGGRRLAAAAGEEGDGSTGERDVPAWAHVVLPAPMEQGHRGQQAKRPVQQQQQQQQQQKLGPSLRRLQRLMAGRQGDDGVMSTYRGAGEAARNCFEMFNPTDEATYKKVVGDWLGAFLVLLRHINSKQAAGGAG